MLLPLLTLKDVRILYIVESKMHRQQDFEISNEMYISFYGRANSFSNFFPSPITIESEQLNNLGIPIGRQMKLQFKTAEAFYQWKKAMASPVENQCFKINNSPPDGTVCEYIRTAATPAQAKAIGRRSVRMNLKTWSLSARISAMRDVIAAKFSHVIEVEKLPKQWDPNTTYKCDRRVALSVQLLCTGNAILVECSPFDKLWGVGKNEHDFQYFLEKHCFITDLSENQLLSSLFDVPINNVETPCENIGANHLGRILMDRRLELREACLALFSKPLVKPLSVVNNKLYARRMKRNAQHVEDGPSKKICTR